MTHQASVYALPKPEDRRTPRAPDLQAMATRLWPDNDYMQGEWLRAIAVVRSTTRGWLLERR